MSCFILPLYLHYVGLKDLCGILQLTTETVLRRADLLVVVKICYLYILNLECTGIYKLYIIYINTTGI